jgi:hypothetical protein
MHHLGSGEFMLFTDDTGVVAGHRVTGAREEESEGDQHDGDEGDDDCEVGAEQQMWCVLIGEKHRLCHENHSLPAIAPLESRFPIGLTTLPPTPGFAASPTYYISHTVSVGRNCVSFQNDTHALIWAVI